MIPFRITLELWTSRAEPGKILKIIINTTDTKSVKFYEIRKWGKSNKKTIGIITQTYRWILKKVLDYQTPRLIEQRTL